MTEKNAPHENETMHDADAVTEPEQAPEDGRFDIGEGVSGVAETDAETETDPANPEFDDARRSIEGVGEDRDA
ncbi:hypothetical protein [Microcella flavibacter]|uniref:hypothetical protein n=1 Tax=Microcella flavibacter TaxID=1804990 RepID=UPI0014573013|nr:hypothetical protein [Microcella flavibacter]